MSWALYGSYGYTGRLIVEEALKRGHRPTLLGRSEAKVRAQAEAHDLPWSCVDLADADALTQALEPHEAILHCAGPFASTFLPMVESCLQSSTSYLDITGEIGVLEMAARLGPKAEAAGIVLMPAVGFDVVPTDCTARRLAEALPGATHLDIAFAAMTSMSAGTARSTIEGMKHRGAERVHGKIVSCPAGSMTRMVPFADKERHCVIVPWGDVSTAFHTTAIPNIRTWTSLPPSALKWLRLSGALRPLLSAAPLQWLLKSLATRFIDGPGAELQAQGSCQVWAEARRGDQRVSAGLTGPEAYGLTASTALLCLEKTLAGEASPGFQTPAGAFGAGLIEEVEGVVIHPVVRQG